MRSELVRLDFRWGEEVVDTVSVRLGQPAQFTGPAGHFFEAAVREDEGQLVTEVTWAGPSGRETLFVVPGESFGVGALEVDCSASSEQLGPRFGLTVDSNLLNTGLVTFAMHVCVVAALWMTPKSPTRPESGGGMPVHEMRRILKSTPIGVASQKGPPRFSPQGERPEESERVFELHESKGKTTHTRSRRTKRRSVTEVLDEITEELNNGQDDAELKRALGELTWTPPKSDAIAAAGMGGLPLPKPSVNPGEGEGVVGVGDSLLIDQMRHTAKESEAVRERVNPLPSERDVEVEAQANGIANGIDDLPKTLRDHIRRKVRERQKSVRYCYESRGLSRVPDQTGKLTLTFVLNPDGHTSDIDVDVDNDDLKLTADCVREQVSEWYLGAALEEPRRLQFRFLLQPSER